VDSPRQMPSKLLAPQYPDRFEVRYVSANGGIRWHKKWVNISSVLIGEHVGLEEVDDGQWDIYFANYRVGRLNERLMRIEDSLGKLKRRVQLINPDYLSPIIPTVQRQVTWRLARLVPRLFEYGS
jgi:hypothetical protein